MCCPACVWAPSTPPPSGVDLTRGSGTGPVRGLRRHLLPRERKGQSGGRDRPGRGEGGHKLARGRWAPLPAEAKGSREGQGELVRGQSAASFRQQCIAACRSRPPFSWGPLVLAWVLWFQGMPPCAPVQPGTAPHRHLRRLPRGTVPTRLCVVGQPMSHQPHALPMYSVYSVS